MFISFALLLCLLTAFTVKDLTIREWDLALRPAREAQATAKELRAEIDALQKQKADLEQDTATSVAFWSARIAETEQQLDSLQRRKRETLQEYTDRLRELTQSSLDPAARERARALEQMRDQELATFEKSLSELAAQLEAARADVRASHDSQAEAQRRRLELAADERKRSEEQAVSAQRAADEAYERELKVFEKDRAAYEDRRREYEAARERANAKLAAELKENEGKDRAFFNLDAKQAEARKAHATELARLEADFRKVKEPVRPERKVIEAARAGSEVPAQAVPPAAPIASARTVELEAAISEKSRAREEALSRRNAEIRSIFETAAQISGGSAEDLRGKRAVLDKRYEGLLQSFDSQISALLDRRAAEQDERARRTRSPAEIEHEKETITARVPALLKQAEQAELQSERLSKDTNAFRSATGVVRWLMPNSTPEQHEATAYAVFPVLIALLVSILPALLLELAVHSLHIESMGVIRPSRPWIQRLWRGSKALKVLQARAREACERAARDSELCAARVRCFELEQQTRIDDSVKAATAAAEARVQALAGQLREAEDRAASAERERVELAKASGELSATIAKQSSDIKLLAERVVRYDAELNRRR